MAGESGDADGRSLTQTARELVNRFPFSRGKVHERDLHVCERTLTLDAPRLPSGRLVAFVFFFCAFPSILLFIVERGNTAGFKNDHAWSSEELLTVWAILSTCSSMVGLLCVRLAIKENRYRDVDGRRRLLSVVLNKDVTVHWQQVVIPWEEFESFASIAINDPDLDGKATARFVVARRSGEKPTVVVCRYGRSWMHPHALLADRLNQFCATAGQGK